MEMQLLMVIQKLGITSKFMEMQRLAGCVQLMIMLKSMEMQSLMKVHILREMRSFINN
jgi:hypothetical protein